MFKPVKSFPSFLTGKKRGTCTGFRIISIVSYCDCSTKQLLYLLGCVLFYIVGYYYRYCLIVQQSSSCPGGRGYSLYSNDKDDRRIF